MRPSAKPPAPVRAPAGAPLSALIEHTLLAATAPYAAVDRHCAEARSHALLAVCVNPVHVARAAAQLAGTPVRVVSVVGFPLGANAPETKAFECALAVHHGADEIDVVMNLGALKAADRRLVVEDVTRVVAAAAGRPVKVILETTLLDAGEKRLACELAVQAGARFVKTSTGFGGAGATVADVALLRDVVGADIGVKASGGIRDAAFARELLAAGADRIGTSVGPALVGAAP